MGRGLTLTRLFVSLMSWQVNEDLLDAYKPAEKPKEVRARTHVRPICRIWNPVLFFSLANALMGTRTPPLCLCRVIEI